MGTQLHALGLEASECPESWNLSHPDRVESVHRAYLDAGADVIITNTLGGTRLKLEKYHLASQLIPINESAARIARSAAGPDRFVLGDLGPTGELIAPLGLRRLIEFENAFAEQIRPLLSGGVDGIIIETMTAIEETEAALRAARALTNLPVLVSMQFKRDADGLGLHTMMGVDVPTFAARCASLGADALGGNCSSPEELLDVIGILKQETDLPLFAEPNAGMPQLINWKTVFALDPERFALAAIDITKNGANIIGGCCGTTPQHIRTLIRRIRPA